MNLLGKLNTLASATVIMLIVSLSAQAAPISVTLTGSNGAVVIDEIGIPDGVEYEVSIVDTNLTLTAFGVTNVVDSTYSTGHNKLNWSSNYLTKSEWDTGDVFSYLGENVSTTALGSFESLFGLTEDAVAWFWQTSNQTIDALGYNSGNAHTGFKLVNAADFSEFAAFNGNNLVSQSIEVPEPSVLITFALGLMGLGVRRFNKQA
jgi:hypothetical protein